MFGDDSTVGASVTVTTSPPDPQDIPLALTTRSDSYIEYSAATVQQHQQSRPGVIVVKQVTNLVHFPFKCCSDFQARLIVKKVLLAVR